MLGENDRQRLVRLASRVAEDAKALQMAAGALTDKLVQLHVMDVDHSTRKLLEEFTDMLGTWEDVE